MIRSANCTTRIFTGSLFGLFLALCPIPLLSEQSAIEDTHCTGTNAVWMELFRENGIKGASLSVKFAWDHDIKNLHLEKVRYFGDYNQTNSTEIKDEEKITSLGSGVEDQIHKYALPRITEIIKKEAEATGLGRAYGWFTYSVYDDPCRKTGYFSPKFADPDETDLMREAEAHHVARLQDLLKDVTVTNLRDQYGRTALLHATILSQSSSTVAALLAAGADPNLSDSRGTTALINASQLGELDTVQLLLSHGADINARNDVGETALMQGSAAGRHGLGIVRLLISSGASINEQDAGGKTALMLAAREGNLEIVQDLLRARANTKATDKRCKTAADYARDSAAIGGRQRGEIIRLLETHSAPQ